MKNNFPKAPPAPNSRDRRRYRLWALALVTLGALLLAANFGLGAGLPAWRPALLVGLGLLVLALGWPGTAAPPFAIERGAYESAWLEVSAGLADLRLGAFAGLSQLAVGDFTAYSGPRLEGSGSQARLIMNDRAAQPLLFGDWSAALSKSLPWQMDLRLGLGRSWLDLRDLSVAGLRLRALAGDVDLTLPAQGQGEMELRLVFGDLNLRVPEGVAVRLQLDFGPLGRARQDLSQHFIQVSPSEYLTPRFSTYANRQTLVLGLSAGNLSVELA